MAYIVAPTDIPPQTQHDFCFVRVMHLPCLYCMHVVLDIALL